MFGSVKHSAPPRHKQKPTGSPSRVHVASRKKIAQRRLLQHEDSARFKHEREEMKETQDLRQVDDDVEDVATILEWHAREHAHRPKSAGWFIVLAVAATVLVGIFVVTFNIIGAVTTAFASALIYYLAQKEPAIVRYRIMVDGVATNNTLYHFRDLQSFNIIYEPGKVKTVILRSKHALTPLMHMEIGDADPVTIREILLEFLPEDQEMDEPIIDILARRLGF